MDNTLVKARRSEQEQAEQERAEQEVVLEGMDGSVRYECTC